MHGMSMAASLPPLTVARFFTQWSLHPWSAVALAVLLAGYLLGVGSARRRGSPWRRRDTASWVVGIAVLSVATQGSPAVYGDALFWMHMVAHLMLIMVAPILLVLGRPLDLVIAAADEPHRPHRRARLNGPLVSLLTHPGVGLVVYGAVIAGTHLTGFMNTMMMHPWLHGLEELVYVVAGVLFFVPLVGEQPIRWKLAAPLRMAIFTVAMPIDTFTGVILGETTKYPWPMMAAMHPKWAPSLLTDLHAGGAVMWVGGDAIMVVLIGLAALTWARAAAEGDGSELGGWLNTARINYQNDLLAGADRAQTAVGAPDSDEALESYNAYLARLNGGT
jgi:putative copper resistance protein D